MKILYLVFTVQLLVISVLLFSQPGKPSVSMEPVWITKNDIDFSNTSLDKHAVDGYIDNCVEKQVSLSEQSEYSRRAIKIISRAGVQNGSEISVSFDPSFEQLKFHRINIIRGGEILNRLQLSNIKTVQQEKELNNHIYNGSLNAILFLEDVRQGDVIEYSYTIKGFNPIFKNKYAAEYYMEFAFPVYDFYYKLIVPQGRIINIKSLNQNLHPVITSVDGQQVYEWRKKNTPPLILQDYTADWYYPYAEILVSEYNNWKEVNDWALELFPIKKELSAALWKKIKEIEKEYANVEGKVKAALSFVQDDIRYMGIELGENSHKPADPSKVFAQRFGDCKEKSYLLCCMLRAMNIEANPVLINTERKKNINSLLPAPGDFDHVTVRVNLDNKSYWFDPTIAYQRGNIKGLFYPDFQAGLVISENTTSLTPVVFRNISYTHVREYFEVRGMSGGGLLTVTTSFQGSAAEAIRGEFYNQSITELMTSYQKFYANYYADIIADSLTYTDDDNTGIFKTTEYYSIPDFWTVDKKVKKFSISPFIVNSILRRPRENNRRMPFALMFPAKYKEDVIVDLPHGWNVSENETSLKNPSFGYDCKFYCVENRVHLVTNYENYKDHVTIEDAPAYFKDLNEYDEIASFELTSGNEELENKYSKNSGKNILLWVLLFGAGAGGFVWWTQRKN